MFSSPFGSVGVAKTAGNASCTASGGQGLYLQALGSRIRLEGLPRRRFLRDGRSRVGCPFLTASCNGSLSLGPAMDDLSQRGILTRDDRGNIQHQPEFAAELLPPPVARPHRLQIVADVFSASSALPPASYLLAHRCLAGVRLLLRAGYSASLWAFRIELPLARRSLRRYGDARPNCRVRKVSHRVSGGVAFSTRSGCSFDHSPASRNSASRNSMLVFARASAHDRELLPRPRRYGELRQGVNGGACTAASAARAYNPAA